MNKFTIVGVSRHDGVMKVRFGNDITRVKVMAKKGDTDINMLEMPHPMEKGEAVKYLMTTELMEDAEVAEAIEDSNEKYNPTPKAAKAPKAAKTAVVKAKKTSKPKATETPVEKLEKLKTRAKAKVAV